MKNVLQAVGAVLAVVVVILGAYNYIDNRYALKNQLRNIEIRLEIKIKSDDIRQIQDRLWTLEDRLAEQEDATLREELRTLRQQYTDTQEELKLLRASIIGTSD